MKRGTSALIAASSRTVCVSTITSRNPCSADTTQDARVEPKLTQFADLLDSGGDTRVQGSTFRRRFPNGGAETTRSIVGSGSFTQPVVRSGDVVHQPAVSPRRIPFPAAESL